MTATMFPGLKAQAAGHAQRAFAVAGGKVQTELLGGTIG
jgi:hypothetical protein